jgi:hypothetical protein
MKHARLDYDRIQDPLNLIPLNEPVFLLRAQDVCFIDMLAHYCNLLVKKGVIPEQNFGTPEHPLVTSVQNHIALARNWQLTVKKKNPDLKTAIEVHTIQEAIKSGKTSNDLELDSYKESDANLREQVKQLSAELVSSSDELGKALQNSKDATLERNNMSQAVASMQQQLKHVSRLDNIEDVKEYLANYGKLSAQEVNEINRDQKNLPPNPNG